MSLLSFKSNTKEKSVLLFDIGNGTITGSLVYFKQGEKPKFLYICKEFFATSEKLDAKSLESQMNTLFEEVVKNTLKKGLEHKFWNQNKKRVDSAMISFSSPWFLSKTKHIHLTNEKEFVITQKFLNEIVEKEIQVLKVELNNDGGKDTYSVIESSIVHGKINGYTVNDLIGKETKNFDASLYISVINDTFKQKIFDTVSKVTHLLPKSIHLNTFPLVLFSVIRDLFTKEENFLLMDITSEVTDITLVNGDIIEKTVSFPSGKNFILRQLAKNLSVSPEIAESTLKLFINKKLNDDVLLKVNDTLTEVEKEWSIYLETALLEISPEMNLPHTLFMTADAEASQIFNQYLTIQKLDATSLWRKNVRITHIDLDKLSTFFQNDSGFLLDEFIVVLSLFYKKISE